MRIRYKKPDPRAGMVVEMSETRARELIDAGSAEAVKATTEAPERKAEMTAPENKARRVAPVRTGPISAPVRPVTKTTARKTAKKGR